MNGFRKAELNHEFFITVVRNKSCLTAGAFKLQGFQVAKLLVGLV